MDHSPGEPLGAWGMGSSTPTLTCHPNRMSLMTEPKPKGGLGLPCGAPLQRGAR
jgi:hypothetical protein